jgi:cephalosporin hydroxylase
VSRDQETREAFHRLYYDAAQRGGTWVDTHWLGVKTMKCPLDLWVYQEILHATRPDLIVECGTAAGGSTLYLASICELLGHGRVVSIDVTEDPGRPRHERITYLLGSSVAPGVHEAVARMAAGKRVLAILDSDHAMKHVLEEMRLYGKLVTGGSYLIVEDTNVNGNPVFPSFGPGPMEAVRAFLAESRDFEVDATKEKFLLTFNPRGYLRKAR